MGENGFVIKLPQYAVQSMDIMFPGYIAHRSLIFDVKRLIKRKKIGRCFRG